MTDIAYFALAVLGVFGGLLLLGCAIGMWLEDHAPIRDEDEELLGHVRIAYDDRDRRAA